MQLAKTTVFFAYFDAKKSAGGTGLGFAWTIVEPLVRMIIYLFVFSVVLRVRLPGDGGTFAYTVYILLGMVPWLHISGVLNSGAALVPSHVAFIRQPSFPHKILPNVVLLVQLPAYAVSMVVLLVLLAVDQQIHAVNWPLLVAVQVLIWVTIRGSATVLGIAAAAIPDIRQVLNLLLMAAVYLSPIFYLPEQLGRFVFVAMVNPASYLLTSFKFAMTGEAAYTLLGPLNDFLVLLCLAGAAALAERAAMRRLRVTGVDRVA